MLNRETRIKWLKKKKSFLRKFSGVVANWNRKNEWLRRSMSILTSVGIVLYEHNEKHTLLWTCELSAQGTLRYKNKESLFFFLHFLWNKSESKKILVKPCFFLKVTEESTWYTRMVLWNYRHLFECKFKLFIK